MWKISMNGYVNIIAALRRDLNVYESVKHATKINMECAIVI